LSVLVDNPAFPRSSAYDPAWIAENPMGPNVLWLAESLSHVLELRSDRREAHQLPFAHDFFDVVVALDSYHYFGTDDCCIGYITRHLKADGLVEVEHADLVPAGWRHWLASERATGFSEEVPAWAAALEADAGRTFGFARVVARKLQVDRALRPTWT
jgi:SAM-dependent methyltransferase